MDVFEAARTLLAVRAFDSRPIPDDVVRRIVEAGRTTGSSQNRQPWHFVVVQDRDTLRQLAEAAGTGPYIADAPLAVGVAIRRDSRPGVSDGSRAIQSMMLAAWGDGVGSNWVGFAGRMDEANRLLGLPEEFDLLAILPFGYPSKKIGKGRKTRKPLNDVASRERFGEGFE